MKKVDKKTLDGKKLLLSLLYSPGKTDKTNEEIYGRTRLMKMVFLFEEEIEKKFLKNIVINDYEFEPYYYGPFCRTLLDDLNFLVSVGMIVNNDENKIYNYEDDETFVNEDEKLKEDNYIDFEEIFKLTNIGMNFVENKIWNIYSKEQKEIFHLFKRRINETSLDTLLNYVYNKYPDKATKSLIAKKYIKGDKKC